MHCKRLFVPPTRTVRGESWKRSRGGPLTADLPSDQGIGNGQNGSNRQQNRHPSFLHENENQNTSINEQNPKGRAALEMPWRRKTEEDILHERERAPRWGSHCPEGGAASGAKATR